MSVRKYQLKVMISSCDVALTLFLLAFFRQKSASALKIDGAQNETEFYEYSFSVNSSEYSWIAYEDPDYFEEMFKEKRKMFVALHCTKRCEVLQKSTLSSFGTIEGNPSEGLFNPADDENLAVFSALPGSSVNITCLTQNHHEWTVTAPHFRISESLHVHHELDEVRDLLELWSANISFANINYFSTLVLSNVSSDHVGSYSCFESNSSESLSENIHLYVEDTLSPVGFPTNFPNLTRLVVEVEEGQRALIPCRPSHPNFEVTLIKRGDVNFDYNYHFHPRLGFIFMRANKTLHSGLYLCLFSSYHVYEEKRKIQLKVLDNHKLTTETFKKRGSSSTYRNISQSNDDFEATSSKGFTALISRIHVWIGCLIAVMG